MGVRPRLALARVPADVAVEAVVRGGGGVAGVEGQPDAPVWTFGGTETRCRAR